VNRILRIGLVACATTGLLNVTGYALAEGPGDPAAATSEDGAWKDKDGNPTFKIENGKVDWYTYVGFTRYSAECLRCHGPDGMGSTYAPALIDSMKRLNFMEFYSTVASGKQAVSASQNLVMPALGEDKNVMCFINEIYTYLRARSVDAIGRGRPEKHDPKPPGFEHTVDQCMG
jgi:methanol metabolism-related c-type cytochrome